MRPLSIALSLLIAGCSHDMGEGLLTRSDAPGTNVTAPAELSVFVTLNVRDEPIEMHWLLLETSGVTAWLYSCEPFLDAGELELTPWDGSYDETVCDGAHLLYEEVQPSDAQTLAWVSASGRVTVDYDAATDTAEIDIDASMVPDPSFENDLARGTFQLSGSIHLRETGRGG